MRFSRIGDFQFLFRREIGTENPVSFFEKNFQFFQS